MPGGLKLPAFLGKLLLGAGRSKERELWPEERAEVPLDDLGPLKSSSDQSPPGKRLPGELDPGAIAKEKMNVPDDEANNEPAAQTPEDRAQLHARKARENLRETQHEEESAIHESALAIAVTEPVEFPAPIDPE